MDQDLKGPEPARLVIAYAFPPYSDTSSIVAGKRVHEYGKPVDVIQNALDDLRSPDEGLDAVTGGLVHRRRVLPTRTAFSGWLAISEFCEAGMQTLDEWDQERGEPYESVYSRAHFVASHFLAARYASTRPDSTWVAEFSDPLSHDAAGGIRHAPVREGELLEFCRQALKSRGFELPRSGNVYEWCEYLAFGLADQVVFTNAAQRDYMIERCGDPHLAEVVLRKAVIAPQPTLPSRFYTMADPAYPLSPSVINIGYFGNFYATRSAHAVLAALGTLPPADRQRLQLHVFTSRPDSLTRDISAAALDDTVIVRPLAPYLDFLALTRRMDVLLAIDAATPKGARENPFLLSKWSDYRGSGSPVWGLVAEGSELSRQGLAYRSPLNHATAAQQVLISLARDGVRLPGPSRG